MSNTNSSIGVKTRIAFDIDAKGLAAAGLITLGRTCVGVITV